MVAAAQVLHEACPAATVRSERIVFGPRIGRSRAFESAVISLHAVVRVLLEDVSRCRGEFVDHARVERRPVRADLDRIRTRVQRADEQRPSSTGIAAFGYPDIDDLAVLVDRAVALCRAAGELDVSLVDEPTIPARVPC